MIYDCIYRLTSYGEICSGQYNEDTGEIIGLDKDILSFSTGISFSSLIPKSFEGESNTLATAEIYMYENKNARLGVNFIIRCIPIFTADNKIVALTNDGINVMRQVSSMTIDLSLKEVGYRPTKVRQLIAKPTPYRLIYSQSKDCFITQDGLLKPGFDVSKLGKISAQYFGYKELILNKDYYAVVYIDNNPVFLRKDGDTLNLIGG